MIPLDAIKRAAEGAHRTFVPLEIQRNEDGTVDEVVVCGNVHVEQMDTGSWWIGIDTADGRLLHLNFHARGKITLNVEDQGPSEHAAHLGHCDPATVLALVRAVEAARAQEESGLRLEAHMRRCQDCRESRTSNDCGVGPVMAAVDAATTALTAALLPFTDAPVAGVEGEMR
jgi:hypothetical protein